MLAKPLSFSNLRLNDPGYDEDVTKAGSDGDTRLMEMMAAQAAHAAAGALEDVEAVASDKKLLDQEKKDILQKALNMAASNGNVEQVKKLLQGSSKQYVDINAVDEDGTPPLIFASCFVCHPVYWWLCRTNKFRGTTVLFGPSSTPEPILTSKTATIGAL